MIDAKKSTRGEKDALALAKQVDEIYAAKGKKLVHIDMKKDKPDAMTLRGVLLGPTGNLRAPALRVGRTLVIGFDREMYERVLG